MTKLDKIKESIQIQLGNFVATEDVKIKLITKLSKNILQIYDNCHKKYFFKLLECFSHDKIESLCTIISPSHI